MRQPERELKKVSEIQTDFAEGFSIQDHKGYKTLTITNPWPGAEKEFTYALVEKGTVVEFQSQFDAIVEVPLKSIVVTSTTHIPSLEALGVSDKLVGFPNLDYISSEKTRNRIDNAEITELGKNESINAEVLIDLSPSAVVTFAVEGDNKTVATIERTGIPVLYNADWTETTPLGKAEWIKFFGVLFNKEATADSIFNHIKTEYIAARKIAQNAKETPTVLSGAMYKDVWYLPQGDSWAARFIQDANANYLWSDTKGTGSISLHIESVLEKGQKADYWIGPGQFTSLSQMKEHSKVYAQFEAFQQNNVFSFTTKKGATGGVVYYELAPNRPDLVLKDMIKIFHPELLQDYELYFFSKLD
ncbi:iron complex transport system substrate-binding protein [Marinirhabdus gelatinilytica]|uniref:Iron complex transport system substrate-binding protein n=2 Tax=Marinirhabdus gelatinilytica TaxID=1703343 RepID=A0A370QFN8_9FLAO|nr:iron complex transport system substrate-binding protein [Marinirhabdus gelatinilytica]